VKRALIVARRELASAFNSPLAYIFITAFLVSCAVFFFFVGGFFAAGIASLRGWFGLMPLMLSVLMPALTMRTWAEEKRQGTYESLLTLPFTGLELVAGKYLATMAVASLALVASLPVPLMAGAFGSFDPGTVASEYLGVLLLASASAAIGQAISSATRNQMSAFLAGVALLTALNLTGQAIVWLDPPSWLAGVVNWFSLSNRFSSFIRGVLDTGDLAFFLLVTAAFLRLTMLSLERVRRDRGSAGPRRRRERLLSALVALAFALGAWATDLHRLRLDLTASRAFTLSEAARNLRREIPETVRITYYLSGSLAERHPGPAAIEDFLRELAAVSRGRIAFRVTDPGEDGSAADAFGVAPQQMQVVERSEQRVAVVYTGIVIQYLDRWHTIPAVIGTETLEYETVKAIRSLVADAKPVVALLAGDDDKSLEADYRTLAATLEGAGYELREAARGAEIDPDVTVLFVLGNAALDDRDAYWIDRHVMRGGRVFFAAKGVDVNPDYGLLAQQVADGGILSLLSAWGIDLARELVLDQSSLTVPFQTQGAAGGYAVSYVRYPHWVALDARYANGSHPVTARFSGLDLYWPSPLATRPLPGIEYLDLVKTTPRAWRQTRDFAAGPDDQELYDDEREATEGQYLVGLSASGSFPSAFAASPVPDGAPPPGPTAPASSPPTRIVVVSSADFLTDLMQMSQSGFNASFALSAADWLSSSDDLIAIRARAESDPRLNRIKDERDKAFMISLTYLVNLGLVPLALILYGVARAWKRSRREAAARAGRGSEA